MTSFWISEPLILFQTTDIWPNDAMDPTEKLNAISRLIIILMLVGYALTRTPKIILTGLITLAAIVILWYVKQNKFEGFDSNISLTPEVFTEPSVKNPMMNVMLDEIHQEGDRPRAAPSFDPQIESKINQMTKKIASNGDAAIESKLFGNLGDEAEFQHSMRAFHPTANTQIPNDQDAFLKFCYKNKKDEDI